MLSLGELVERDGPLSVRDAIGWTLRTALALWSLHADGKVHGRLHAGAVRVEAAACTSEGVLTRPSRLADAAAYHSLDRADGAGPSMRDDVWALGILLYFLLTGETPFPGGVAASVDGRRLRPPRPLAVHRAELDVMQPVVDRMIRLDLHGVVATVEEVVGGLRDFSPAIADLPPLGIERPTTLPPAPEARVETRRRMVWWALAVGFIALLAGILVGLSRGDDAPDAPETAEVNAPGQPDRPRGGASAAPPASPGGGPSAVPTAGPSAPRPPGGGSSGAEGDADLVACLSPLFAGEPFPSPVTADFPCRERDPKSLVVAITKALAQGAAGRATTGSRDWDALGWYRLATAAVARGRCCEAPPPLVSSPLLATCGIDPALQGLTDATDRGDAELSAALEGYRKAMRCVSTAAGGPLLDPQLEGSPTGTQAAFFIRVLTRVRARP